MSRTGMVLRVQVRDGVSGKNHSVEYAEIFPSYAELMLALDERGVASPVITRLTINVAVPYCLADRLSVNVVNADLKIDAIFTGSHLQLTTLVRDGEETETAYVILVDALRRGLIELRVSHLKALEALPPGRQA